MKKKLLKSLREDLVIEMNTANKPPKAIKLTNLDEEIKKTQHKRVIIYKQEKILKTKNN